MAEIIEKLKTELIKRFEENSNSLHVAITMHVNPDPDCIGSACGMKRIIREWIPEAEVSLVYMGEISHPQNRTMVNVLNLNLIHVDEIDGGLKDSDAVQDFADAYIAVDVMPERSAIPNADYLFVVDHHKSDTKKTKIKDIQYVGAASTIVWSYMDKIGLELDKTSEEDSRVATALIVGIKTDTCELVTDAVTDLDFDAYKHLIGAMDQKSMIKIIDYPVPPYYIELKKRLDQEDHAISENGVYLGGIGYISPAKRDVLSSIAEERARVEGIDTSFIVAIVGSNLEVSVRSSGWAIDVEKLCKNIFGKEYAGGKMGAGAARIPMGIFSVEDEDEEIQGEAWEFVRRLWFKRILKEMSDHR
jgi:nanoRNase/pAp phosphatase (c-di-AMP/oligoRNAs hydrolase)